MPEGTYEEEHGRRGFYGKSAHVYHTHPPTGWVRFEGKLRPHCFDRNKLEPADRHDPHGAAIPFLGNDDVKLYVSRRSEPMPFYFRNADGDELYFVHRGQRTVETDFGPLAFDYDEFIFYHDGNFFSRQNISPGMATLHPRGIHHGPHPKALAGQTAKTHTDEYAVMLDSLNPIRVLQAGEQVEWKDYWKSWIEE
ncbi:MAG: hypothetical protein HY236_13740 [Acidobacteria bacterium]|nr:hypothetical protein [Acidobacteriota bacterium]